MIERVRATWCHEFSGRNAFEEPHAYVLPGTSGTKNAKNVQCPIRISLNEPEDEVPPEPTVIAVPHIPGYAVIMSQSSIVYGAAPNAVAGMTADETNAELLETCTLPESGVSHVP